MLVMQRRGYNFPLYEERWCTESVGGQSGLIYPAGEMCGWTITERGVLGVVVLMKGCVHDPQEA